MPTYEYKCDACGNLFEKFQPITSAPVRKCPKCGKNKVRRLISAGAGLIFKGSGFYITDYRDSGYNEKKNADTAAEKPADGKAADGKSADSKPAENKPAESGSDSSKPAASDSKPSEPRTEKPAAKESAQKSESKPEPKASKSAKKR